MKIPIIAQTLLEESLIIYNLHSPIVEKKLIHHHSYQTTINVGNISTTSRNKIKHHRRQMQDEQEYEQTQDTFSTRMITIYLEKEQKIKNLLPI